MTDGGRRWFLDPHSGSSKIPEVVRRETITRLERYAAEHLAGLYTRLDIRCRGSLCYVDVFAEPEEPSPSLLQLIGETLATVSLVAFKGQTVCLLVEAADGVTANLVQAAIDDVHVSRD